MRVLQRLLWVGLSLALLSCRSDGLSPAADVERRQAQARWNALGLTRYTVEARMLCFCAPGLGLWHELTVRDDLVVASRLVEVSPQGVQLPPGALLTVDQMFRVIDAWFSNQAGPKRGERISATFDATTGLPTGVTFEASPEMPNGITTYQYRALKPQ